jgi:hypothetical protein
MAIDKVKRIPQLPPASTLGDADLFLVHQNNAAKKVTFSTLRSIMGSGGGTGGSTQTGGAKWFADRTYSEGDIVTIGSNNIAYVSQQAVNLNHPVASDDGTWWKYLHADALSIRGRQISSTTPTDKQTLAYNISTDQWEPQTATGSLTIDENSVDVRINDDNIQWQFDGGLWYNLITLTEIRQAAVPEISFFDGDGHTLEFGPVAGLASNNPNKCLVVVGGVTQHPTVSYTLSTANGGKLIFSEAPPNNVKISIQPY